MLQYAQPSFGDGPLSGPKVTGDEARAMPEFGPEGRLPFFSSDPVEHWLTNPRSGLGLDPVKLASIAVALADKIDTAFGAPPRAGDASDEPTQDTRAHCASGEFLNQAAIGV